MTIAPHPPADAGALAERAFESAIATTELACLYVGDRLGLYAKLHELGPATAAQLASHAQTDERYTREWLEQQASAAVLICLDPDAAPADRRFVLPAEHAEALLDPESPVATPGFARLTLGVLTALPQLLDAFRTGAGIPYPAYGEDTREGIAAGNRPMFANELGRDWIPAAPDVHERLSSRPCHVADLACGLGWSSLAIARAYPLARVDGIDEDVASIERARGNAATAGLADRVRFFAHDAADDSLTGTYDLVTIFEALHDMAHPVEALRSARGLLAAGGSVIVGDEKVGERFAPPGDPVERLSYGFSVLHCLPVGRVGEHSAATGTVIRPDTVRAYAEQAGFTHVEVLPIDHDLWRFYRLSQ